MATIKEKIFAQLVSAILEGEMKAGTPFPTEAELCRRYDVSRTTVRGALRMLREAHLLDSFQGSGNYVIGLPPGEFGRFTSHFRVGRIRDWFAVRRALESDWAYLAARDRSEAQLGELRTILAAMERIVPDNPASIVKYRNLDIAFHAAIAAISGNGLATALSRLISPMIMSPLPFDMELVSAYPEEAERAMVRHRAIVEAISDRDAAGAHSQMRSHIDEIMEIALESIRAAKARASG
ncbi:MAG: FadR family transcriptional regulator [Nitratireductor sp.]|nr:FadR family transcriptional regulator [Nitratireductor sp.]MCB1456950.1 FadR family transcriptional regulator [Nitratireductor sp.]MCB1459210.1 FadR family transcriptional regulator [Nitratireductor sp.]